MTKNYESEIIEYIGKLYPLAEHSALGAFVAENYRREHISKKTLLFGAGDANTRHYFVAKGLLRLYIIDNTGREFNLLFAKEGQVLGDLASPKPTVYYLESVEDTVVYSISDTQLQKLSAELLGENKGGGVDLMRRSYVFLQKRLVNILSQTAEENYLELRDDYPELLQRLPQYHIASYLGVSPEFLSKIIARAVKK